VGSRPCATWKAFASSPTRCCTAARRDDHRSIRLAGTPTISRTGRLPLALCRSAYSTPSMSIT
jgi:hypothetical protein